MAGGDKSGAIRAALNEAGNVRELHEGVGTLG
jgi:hypothetical protein